MSEPLTSMPITRMFRNTSLFRVRLQNWLFLCVCFPSSQSMAHLILHFFINIFVLSAHLVRASTICYFPDGETVAPVDYPCNASASVSPCCGPDSWCLDNGLCYHSGIISRGSCTDQNWGVGCAQYCSSGRLHPIALFASLTDVITDGDIS